MVLEGYQYAWLVILFIALFFVVRIAVGIWAGRQVQDNTDYVVAGRRLPIHMAVAFIMATWFAAETRWGLLRRRTTTVSRELSLTPLALLPVSSCPGSFSSA